MPQCLLLLLDGLPKRSSCSLCRRELTKTAQTGHYTYECKSTTQERPYISRPSRTQQLLNPKLQQKLTEAAPPEELPLTTKKGVADSILKKKEEEREGRDRKRRRDGFVLLPGT